MRHRLLDILACPHCGNYPLGVAIPQEDGKGSLHNSKEVLRALLSCSDCGQEFKIEEGIANFISQNSNNEDSVMRQKSEYDSTRHEKSSWYPKVLVERIKSKIDTSFNENSFLLDLGTGLGFWANELSNNLSAVGLDIDMFNLHNGRKKYPNVDFVCANATKLPFKDNSVSVIFSGLFLHHLYLFGLDKIFAEIHRILAPGGQFLAYEPNKLNPVSNMRLRFFQFLIRHFGHDFVWDKFGYFETLQERFLSPRQVHSMANKVGLESSIETCFGIPSVTLDRMPFLHKANQVLEKNIFLAGSFFLTGRKNLLNTDNE